MNALAVLCEVRTSHSNRTLPACQPTAGPRRRGPQDRDLAGAPGGAPGVLSEQSDVDESQRVLAKGLHGSPEAILQYPKLDPQFLVVQQSPEGPLATL